MEIVKHLQVLRELGPCRIVSARHRPVGMGWTPAQYDAARKRGFEVVFREDAVRGVTGGQAVGLIYGAVCKGLGLEKAFPHANPYHRYAFPAEWWRRMSEGFDLAVFNYSYWCGLPCPMPKALALHDLWSNYMWGGTRTETREIRSCAHTFVISVEESAQLRARGITSVSWCPPAIPAVDLPLEPSCALLGSGNTFNIEGLRWLESAGAALADAGIKVYGALATSVRRTELIAAGRYAGQWDPYRENGIVLFATVQGMGAQIKTIEALAAGRAIVARRGAVRGLPSGDGAWIEVDTPEDALAWIVRLRKDHTLRSEWSARARAYYDEHLMASRIIDDMRERYHTLADATMGEGMHE